MAYPVRAAKAAQQRPGESRTVEVMDVRLFGQLEAADGGVAFAVRGAKQRALLALLARCIAASRSAPTG